MILSKTWPFDSRTYFYNTTPSLQLKTQYTMGPWVKKEGKGKMSQDAYDNLVFFLKVTAVGLIVLLVVVTIFQFL
jgi:hypothetical protein